MIRRLIRHLPMAAALLSLTVLPQAAFGADAPINLGPSPTDASRHITIKITDSGFDKKSYSVMTTASDRADTGSIDIINDGTRVHTATMVPGSGFLQVNEDQYVGCSRRTCSSTGPLDTGGIAPGDKVNIELPYTGKIMFTSATDCPPFGNATSGFDCTPVQLQVRSAPPSSMIAQSMEGTIHRLAGGEFDKVRKLNSVKGSSRQPLTGNVTITIDDENGYDPTTLYIRAGTEVTWVNKGQTIHSIRARPPGSAAPDAIHVLDSGGLDSGDRYTYFYDCAPDPGCRHQGGYTSKYISNVLTDTIPARMNGASQSNGTDSVFVGRVVVVPLPS